MNLRLSASIQNPIQPNVNFQRNLKMKPFFHKKNKVVFVVGPTGTGKSRLAIDIATRISGEVINCDKMQVYKGLDIATNKVTDEESRGVPHHLLGIVDDPNADFTCYDFRRHAIDALEVISTRYRLPIIAGGSNSFIDALVNHDPEFRARYECCFLWIDVSLPVLHSFVSDRVEGMVKAGLIDEVQNMFDPKIRDYSRGIRRAIGVPELDQYFRTEEAILDEAISQIKENTCMLACRQLQKIYGLRNRLSQNMHRIDATEAFVKLGKDGEEEAWEKVVARPSAMIVEQFLYDEEDHNSATIPSQTVRTMTATRMAIPVPAVAAR